MSSKKNEEWLLAAYEHFKGAIEQGNYALAKDVIADVLDVSPTAGRAMAQELRDTPVDKFLTPSPYQKEN